MKFVVTSDTYGHLPKITGEYDVFIHAGNFTPSISSDNHQTEIDRQISWMEDFFCPWFKNIHAKHKIIIPGHNDFIAQLLSRDLEKHIDGMYLQDEAATIDGLIFYGMPWLPADSEKYIQSSIDPVYVSPSRRHFQGACKKIPLETHVLITRIPPKGILDMREEMSVGDPDLLHRINDIEKVKIHIFGFASESSSSFVSNNKTVFANAHVKKVDDSYSVLHVEI